jgi:hypothetical protein
VSEPAEDRRGIVTDRGDIQTLALAERQTLLQLDELRTAERSPIGAAVKDEHQPVWPGQLRPAPLPAVRVRERKIRDRLADVRAGLRVRVLGPDEGLELGRRQLAGLAPLL